MSVCTFGASYLCAWVTTEKVVFGC